MTKGPEVQISGFVYAVGNCTSAMSFGMALPLTAGENVLPRAMLKLSAEVAGYSEY